MPLNLDQARKDRLDARAKAAGRENHEEPIVWRNETIAVLPAEPPLSALAPLRRVDQEIAMVLSEIMETASRQGQGAAQTATFLLNMLVQRQDLPSQLIDVVREMTEEIITAEGLAKFLAGKPSPWDYVALISGALAHWGVSLGEASRSTDSSSTGSGGPTSKSTSDTTTSSTSVVSGPDLALPAISESVAS
jgi:hypothetical protein